MSGPVLVTGGGGQLGRALGAAGDVVRLDRPALDFDRPEALAKTIAAIAPRLIVNTAAYTAVDAAESDQAAAHRANAEGPAHLAAIAEQSAIPLIQISTDYVFDGLKGAPYIESDPPAPRSVYGATKLAGERAALDGCSRAIVMRTSWVYAAEGKNFVLTMLAAARKTRHLRVVADQQGCPTNADDLAAAILAVIARIDTGWRPEYRGIFHAAGQGATTWHAFAKAIFETAAHHGVEPPQVAPIPTSAWPTPAHRPPDSRLDCTKLATVFGVQLPPWRPSLDRTVATILNAAS
jgi:dTDP-4-dehydrorhamnose reductase